MAESAKPKSYFSVAFELITLGKPLTFDLYINSSTLQSSERFVRIAPVGEVLNQEDIQKYKAKYRQLYVAETQRGVYLKSLIEQSGRSDTEKVTVLKDSAIHHLQNIFEATELTTEVLAQAITGGKAVVENMVTMIRGYDIDQLRNLIGNLSFHDFYTYDHSINVSMYSILIYKALYPNASDSEVTQAGLGGLLHDLGKIKIPTEIINNAGKLSDEEFNEIRKHPDYGKNFIDEARASIPPGLDGVSIQRAIHEHHENFDGSGYPRKLDGGNIHLLARITAIADFFDAITTKRSYHEPLSTEDALALMKRSAGKKLDPKVFEVFAAKAQSFVANRNSAFELPTDYDPCQPHERLPLQAVPAFQTNKATDPKNPKGFGKVMFIEPKKPAPSRKKTGS